MASVLHLSNFEITNSNVDNNIWDDKVVNGGYKRLTQSCPILKFDEPDELKVSNEEIVEAFSEINETAKSYDYKCDIAIKNYSKNRYPDVCAPDITRIRFKNNPDRYINATMCSLGDQNYIRTQCPMDHTFEDFWQMIWEQNVPVIVSLLPTVRYFPPFGKYAQFHGDYMIDTIALDETNPKIKVHQVKVSFPGLSRPGMKVEHRFIYHLSYQSWPDHGIPAEVNDLEIISQKMHELMSLAQNKTPLIHCMAGVGRTGTLMSYDMMRDKHIRPCQALDVAKEYVMHLRRYCPYLVQNPLQFKFLIQAVIQNARH